MIVSRRNEYQLVTGDVDKDMRAMKDIGLRVDRRLMPLQRVHDTIEWKGVTILDDEKTARKAIKQGQFGNWKWNAKNQGNPGNRHVFCNDHVACLVRLRLKAGDKGCEVAVNVAQEHSLVANSKKRKNSAMTFEQEHATKFAITTSMRTKR